MTTAHRTQAVLEARRKTASGVELLTLSLEAPPAFRPGQYLHCIDADGGAIPFSIASAPTDLPRLELHYQPTAGNADSARMDSLLSAGRFAVELPHGNALPMAQGSRCTWLVGFATGLAPMWAIVQALLEDPRPDRSWVLLHGVRAPEGLYLGDAPARAARRLNNLTLVEAVESRDGCSAVERFQEIAAAHPPDEALLAGSYGAVTAAADRLRSMGLAAERIRSDML